MTKKELQRWQKKLSAAQARVARERDAIRTLIDELDELEDTCHEAEGNLMAAADALSRLV